MGYPDFLSKTPIFGGFIKRPVIPVLRFSGILSDSSRKGALSYERYRKPINKAFALPNLKALVLVINCPGGSPVQSELITSLIRRKAEDAEIPVYAFVEDLAASGGYWLACAADHIYAMHNSITGSIGVVSAGFGLDEFINKHGIERRLYTQGKEKSMLDPFLPEKQSDLKRLKELQKGIHEQFISWVKTRREEKLKGVEDKNIFEGQIWVSSQAKEKGIIDDIGECDQILTSEFGDDHIRVDIPVEKKLLALPFTRTQKNNLFAGISEDVLQYIEDRALWGRFGL